jgi:hypothetical protein
MNPKKVISLLTVTCFLVSFILGDAVAAVLEMTRASSSVDRALGALAIPAGVGRITDSGYFGTGKVVITLQDLHCHPEVQRNIARVLSLLNEKYSFSKIYVEGASGVVNTGWLTGIRDRNIRQALVESLVNRGRITGEEYYSVLSDQPLLQYGIENEALHRENIVRLGKILERQPQYEAVLSGMRRDLAAAQQAHFNRQNRRFNDIVERYRQGKIDAGRYYTLLLKYAKNIKADPARFGTVYTILPENYRTISAYLELLESVRRLNSRKISVQMQRFIGDLKSDLPYSAYTRLLKKTGQFSRQEELCLYLSRIAKEKKLDIRARYPDLHRFLEYREKMEAVNPLTLLVEEKRLTESVRIGLSADMAELEVGFLSEFLGCYEDYLKNRLLVEDYGYFTERFPRFEALWRKYIPGNEIERLSADHALLNEYYRVNMARNNCFIDTILSPDVARAAGTPAETATETDVAANVIASLDKGSEAVIVVTGGFHTGGLVKLLKERRVSYLTITPNVTTDASLSEEVYRTLARHQARIMANALRLVPLSAQYSDEQVTALVEAIEPLFNEDFSKRSIDSAMNKLAEVWDTNDEVQQARKDAGNVGKIRYEYRDEKSGKYYFVIRFEGTDRELSFTVDPAAAKDHRVSLTVKDAAVAEKAEPVAPPAEETQRKEPEIAIAREPEKQAEKEPEQAAEKMPEQKASPDADAKAARAPTGEAASFHDMKDRIAAAGRALKMRSEENGEAYRLTQMVTVMLMILERVDEEGKPLPDAALDDFLAGRKTFREFLDSHPYPAEAEKQNLLKYATDQSPYPLQFLVEAILNGQDATVKLKGISRPVGQFGEGAYQMFKELIGQENAVIVLETSTGDDASRFAIWLEENELMVAFERLPGPVMPRGTRIVIDKKVDNPAEGKQYVEKSLRANAQGYIQDEQGNTINHPENYHYGNRPGETLRSPSEKERPPTRFGIWRDGILFSDDGIGMNTRGVLSQFLTPKITEKKIIPDYIEADSLYKYDINDDQEAVIRPYIKGEKPVHKIDEITVIPADGRFNLAKEMVVAFPRGTRISEDRSVLNLGDRNPVGVQSLEKLIDILTDPKNAAIRDREVQLNTLMQMLRLMRKRANGSGTGVEAALMKYAADRVRENGLLDYYDKNNKIVLPNREAWRGVAPFGREIVYLDEALYQLPDLLPADVFIDVTDELLFKGVSDPALKLYTVPFDATETESPVIVETVDNETHLFVNENVYKAALEDPEILLKRIELELPHTSAAAAALAARFRPDAAAKGAVLQAAAISMAREESRMESRLLTAVNKWDEDQVQDIIEKELKMRTTRTGLFEKKISLMNELKDVSGLSDAEVLHVLNKYGYRQSALSYYRAYSRLHHLGPVLEQQLLSSLKNQGYGEPGAKEILADIDWRLVQASVGRADFAGYATKRYGERISRYNIGRLIDAAKTALREGRLRGGVRGAVRGAFMAFFMVGMELANSFFLRYPGSVLGYYYFGQGNDVYLSRNNLFRVVMDDIAGQISPVVSVRVPLVNAAVRLVDAGSGRFADERTRRLYHSLRRANDIFGVVAERFFVFALARYIKGRANLFFWSGIVAGSIISFLAASPFFLLPLMVAYNYKLFKWAKTIGRTGSSDGRSASRQRWLVGIGTMVWIVPLALSFMGVPLLGFSLLGAIASFAPGTAVALSGMSIAGVFLGSFSVLAVTRPLIAAVTMQFGRFTARHREALIDAHLFGDAFMLASEKGTRGFIRADTERFVPWKFEGDTVIAYLENLVHRREELLLAKEPAKRTMEEEKLSREAATNIALIQMALRHDEQLLVRNRIVRSSEIQKAQIRRLIAHLNQTAPPADKTALATLKRKVAGFNALAEVQTLQDKEYWKTVLGVAFGMWIVGTEIAAYLFQLDFFDGAISRVFGNEIHVFKQFGMLLEGASTANPVQGTGWRLYDAGSFLGNFVINRGGMLGLFNSLVEDATASLPALHLFVNTADVVSLVSSGHAPLSEAIATVNEQKILERNARIAAIEQASRDWVPTVLAEETKKTEKEEPIHQKEKSPVQDKKPSSIRDVLGKLSNFINIQKHLPPSVIERGNMIASGILLLLPPQVTDFLTNLLPANGGDGADAEGASGMFGAGGINFMSMRSSRYTSPDLFGGTVIGKFNRGPVAGSSFQIKEGVIEGDTSRPLVMAEDFILFNGQNEQTLPEIHIDSSKAGPIVGYENISVKFRANYNEEMITLYHRLDGEITDVKATDENGEEFNITRIEGFGNGVQGVYGNASENGNGIIIDNSDLYDGMITLNWTIAIHEKMLDYQFEQEPLPDFEIENMPQEWKQRLDAVKSAPDETKVQAIHGIMQEYFVYDYDNAGNAVTVIDRVGFTGAADQYIHEGRKIPVICEGSTLYFDILAQYVGLPVFTTAIKKPDASNNLFVNKANHAMPVVKVNGEWQIIESLDGVQVEKKSPTWLEPPSKPATRGEQLSVIAAGVLLAFVIYKVIALVSEKPLYWFARWMGLRGFRKYAEPLKAAGEGAIFSQYKPRKYLNNIIVRSFTLFQKKRRDKDVLFQATLPWGRVVLGRNFTHPAWRRTTHEFNKATEGSLYVERNDGAWRLHPFTDSKWILPKLTGNKKIRYVSHKVVGDTLYILGKVNRFFGVFQYGILLQVDEQGEKILPLQNKGLVSFAFDQSFIKGTEQNNYVLQNESFFDMMNPESGMGALRYTLQLLYGVFKTGIVALAPGFIVSLLFMNYNFIESGLIAIVGALVLMLPAIKYHNGTKIMKIGDNGLKQIYQGKQVPSSQIRATVFQGVTNPYVSYIDVPLFGNKALHLLHEDEAGRLKTEIIPLPEMPEDHVLLRQNGELYVAVKQKEDITVIDAKGGTVFVTPNRDIWGAIAGRGFGKEELGADVNEALKTLAAMPVSDLNSISMFLKIGPGYAAQLTDGRVLSLAGKMVANTGDRYLGATENGMILLANAAGDELRILDERGEAVHGTYRFRWATAGERGAVAWNTRILSMTPVFHNNGYYHLLVTERANGTARLTLLAAKEGALTAYDEFSARTGRPISEEIGKIAGIDPALFRKWDQPVRSYYDQKGVTHLENLADDSPYANGASPFVFPGLTAEERQVNYERMQNDAQYIGQLDDSARTAAGLLPGRVKHWSLAYAFMPDLLPVTLTYEGADSLGDFVRKFIDANGTADQDRLRELLQPAVGIYRLGIPDADLIVARYLEAIAADDNGAGEFVQSLRDSLLKAWPVGETKYTGIELLAPERRAEWKELPSLMQFYLTVLTEGFDQVLKKEDESPAPRKLLKTLVGRPGDSLAKLVRVGKRINLKEKGFDEVLRQYEQETGRIRSADIIGAVTGQEGVLPVWIRELVQNARDIVKNTVRRHIRIRSYLNNNRWIVSVRDEGGMSLPVILQKLLVPDATTKSYEAELLEVIQSFMGSTDEELADKILDISFMEAAAKDPLVREKVLDILGGGRDRAAARIAFEFGEKKKLLKKIFAGSKGQGFFTVFDDADEVFIRSGMEGKVYELTLRSVREGKQVVDIEFITMKEYDDPADEFKGTEVRWIKNINDSFTEGHAQMRNNILYYYTAKMIGAISNVEITWNENSILDSMVQMTPSFRISKTGFNRLNVDELYIQEPNAYKVLKFVPHEVANLLLAHGANYDYGPETSVVRTRNAVQDPNRFKRNMALNTLQAAVQLWQRGEIELPGLPPYAEYLQRFPWEDVVPGRTILEDAAEINSGNISEGFWVRYEERYSAHIRLWVELMLSIASQPDGKSVRDMKEERYFGAVPIALKKALEGQQKLKLGIDTGWTKQAENDEDMRRQGLYAYLKAYALLAVAGTVKLEKIPEIGSDANAIAERIYDSDWQVLDEVNDANWQEIALTMHLPEIGASSGMLLRKPESERAEMLRKAGIDRSMENNEATRAIGELFQEFARALGDKFGEEIGRPFLKFELGDRELLKDFAAFIEGGSVVPLAEEFIQHLPENKDERLRHTKALYDGWLKKNIHAQRLREEILKNHSQDDITAALTALETETQRPRYIVVAVNNEPVPEAARAYSLQDNAKAGSWAAMALLLGGIGVISNPADMLHLWFITHVAFLVSMAGFWAYWVYSAHARSVLLADRHRPKDHIPYFELNLKGLTGTDIREMLPTLLAAQLGNDWEKIVDAGTIERMAVALRSHGGERIRFIAAFPEGVYAETQGTTVDFPAWIAARSNDEIFTVERKKMVDMLIVHEGFRLRFGERWVGGLQTAAIYLLKLFVDIRGSTRLAGEALLDALNPRRLSEKVSMAYAIANARYEKTIERLKGVEKDLPGSQIHIAANIGTREEALRLAREGNDRGVHNIAIFAGKPGEDARKLFDIEVAGNLTPVYAQIEEGVHSESLSELQHPKTLLQ